MFRDVPWVSNNTMLIFLVEAKAPLDVLHVDSCFRLRGTAFWHSLCQHANDLTELNVSHVIGINDDFSNLIVERMHKLKVIYMSYTDITGISIKTFADARASEGSVMKIERIHVKGCERVSPDAIAYGRAHGIEIIT